MFNCGGNYNCIDPDAACVEDDDGDGGVLTTADLGEEEDPPASCFDGQYQQPATNNICAV